MSGIDTKILSDHVYETIKSMILEGELPPGQKLNKKELAGALGVSLTPVNEAVSRLTGEKYIEQVKRHGYFVKTYTLEDLEEMYEVRAGLESVAIRLCIARADGEDIRKLCQSFDGFSLPFGKGDLRRYTTADKRFHGRIIQLSDNTMIQEMNQSTGYVLKSYQQGLVRPPEETLGEHAEIISAIRARDADAAQSLIARHHLLSANAVASLSLAH